MTKKLTFKEYLESKEKLLAAVKETPVVSTTYVVKKYCKLPVGACKETKETVALKPKQKVIVEWSYADFDAPEILSIKFSDVDDVDPNNKHMAIWSDERVEKWLLNNTRESRG